MTFDDALSLFVDHNNASVDDLAALKDHERTPLVDHLVGAVNAALSIFVAMGLLPAPGEGCGECEACQRNAELAADRLLAELGLTVADAPERDAA